MATTHASSVRFAGADVRDDEMHSTIERWIDELVDGGDDAQASDEFQAWLDVQSRLRDYSYRNALIKRQCPGGRTGDLGLGASHHDAVSRV